MPTHAMMTNAPSTSAGYRLYQRQQFADYQPHRDDAENAAGENHPRLVRHRHGDKNRVDGKHDVGELDLDDRRPERGQAEHRFRRFGRAPVVPLFPAEEMRVREVQQVRRACELDPAEFDQLDGQQRRNGSKEERAQDAVTKRLFLLVLRKPQNQYREDQGVVCAEKAFEENKKNDCESVSPFKNHVALII